jgi:hypothetical protein
MKTQKAKQQRFDFDSPAAPRRVSVIDRSVTKIEAKRLSSQSQRILELLRTGDRSNDELAAIARKYTSRISDIRKAGYEITIISRDHESGLVVYRLTKDKEAQQ